MPVRLILIAAAVGLVVAISKYRPFAADARRLQPARRTWRTLYTPSLN